MDIKPCNFLVNVINKDLHEYDIKLSDFGTARKS